MTRKPAILIVGATGTVGKAVLPHLIANPNVEPMSGPRNPEKAANLGLPVVYLDLDKTETIEPALQGIDRAFLLTGYTIDMMHVPPTEQRLSQRGETGRCKAHRSPRRVRR